MDAWAAGIASFLGGAGFVGLLRYVIRNKELTLSNEAALRQELQAQITRLNERIEQLELERETLQKQYNELYKMNADLRALLKKESPTNGKHTQHTIPSTNTKDTSTNTETKEN